MKATITFDPERLQKAIVDEIGEHHRHSSSGRCQCNRSTTKDPTQMREHLGAELMAVILRFQEGDVAPQVYAAPEPPGTPWLDYPRIV